MRILPLMLILLLTGRAVANDILSLVEVSYPVTDAQLIYINNHYNYVATSYLDEDIRAAITYPELLLSRSLQGTQENDDHFDWAHVDSREQMFCHDDSLNQNWQSRIVTIWDTFLMDGGDFMEPANPDSFDHWINYYAAITSHQVDSLSYDGLFVDSAGHELDPGIINDSCDMPWDYDVQQWRLDRHTALEHIKSRLSDKLVIFNGLHSGNGADSSLSLTDGGMWDDFAYDIHDGRYNGIDSWSAAIETVNSYKDSCKLVLRVKKPGLIEDMQARMFSVASYLLVSSENVILSISDWHYENSLQFYPEYFLNNLGPAAGDFSVEENGLYRRDFAAGGIVLVNPDSSETMMFNLPRSYMKVVASGGGIVDTSGFSIGSVYLQSVNGTQELPPVSGLILIHLDGLDDEPQTAANYTLSQNYPNPFNPATTIEFNLSRPQELQLTVYNVLGESVAVLAKGTYPAGVHRVIFDTNHNTVGAGSPRQLPSGVYVYRLEAGECGMSRKMILVR